MNQNQKLFCLEYLKDFNATRAYRAVYEKEGELKNPRANAHRLLKKAEVKEFIKEEIEKATTEKIAESEEVLAYFTAVMRGEIEMSDRERNKAAEILAKRYGLLDEQAVSGGGGVTIIDDLGEIKVD